MQVLRINIPLKKIKRGDAVNQPFIPNNRLAAVYSAVIAVISIPQALATGGRPGNNPNHIVEFILDVCLGIRNANTNETFYGQINCVDFFNSGKNEGLSSGIVANNINQFNQSYPNAISIVDNLKCILYFDGVAEKNISTTIKHGFCGGNENLQNAIFNIQFLNKDANNSVAQNIVSHFSALDKQYCGGDLNSLAIGVISTFSAIGGLLFLCAIYQCIKKRCKNSRSDQFSQLDDEHRADVEMQPVHSDGSGPQRVATLSASQH